MYAYKSRVKINTDRKLAIELPADMPEGEAEIIVLSNYDVTQESKAAIVNETVSMLDSWLKGLPDVPHLPASAMDRENLYR